jgi:hypothetical protein
VYSIAFLQLASDVYSLIPFGNAGSGGPPWALAWPAHVLLGDGKVAMGGLGGVAGGMAVAAGSVVAGAASTRVGAQTYGYQ